MSGMDNSAFDVAIIGAGLSGIALARFYLDVHPRSRLVIIEKEPEVGGTWNKSRVFDTFWTQSPSRTTTFADTPLVLPDGATKIYDTFASKYVNQYIQNYVENHVYAGRSLLDRIRLGTEVTGIRKEADGSWVLSLSDGNSSHELRCSRLAIASGMTSKPNMPRIPFGSEWTAPVLHHRDFGVQSKTMLLPDSRYGRITVVGGGKSAADMVYACAKAKKQVSWVIRRTGDGANYFLHSKPMGRYRNAAEASLTVNATRINPSGFRTMAPETISMHQTPEGRAALNKQFTTMDRNFKAWANYQGRDNALPNFQKLEPSYSLFWSRGPPGMMQHDDFFDLVSQNVNVFRADITGTDGDCLVLEDGSRVPTDVLFAGTGWDSTCSFLSSKQMVAMGLPHDPADGEPAEEQAWQAALDEADAAVVRDFPILASPPEGIHPRPRAGAGIKTPARLYQGIACPADPSLVFLGKVRLPNGFFGAEAQAVWATAHWDGNIRLPSPEECRARTARLAAFSRRRYPSDAGDGLNFFRDMIWYVDSLLSEVGLTSHRRRWWEDADEPHVVADLKDCKDEYLAKYYAGQPQEQD